MAIKHTDIAKSTKAIPLDIEKVEEKLANITVKFDFAQLTTKLSKIYDDLKDNEVVLTRMIRHHDMQKPVTIDKSTIEKSVDAATKKISNNSDNFFIAEHDNQPGKK